MSIHPVRQAEEYVVCPTLVCDDPQDKGKSLSVKVPESTASVLPLLGGAG